MDEWLDRVGMYRKNTALDGTCLFRSVAEQLFPADPTNGHLILRQQCCDFMEQNRQMYEPKMCFEFEEYMCALRQSKGWGSVLELDVISLMYNVDFLIYFGPGDPIDVTKNGHDRKLMLCVTNDSFYDAVYKKEYIENLGFCQSIIYNILYTKVFKLKNIDYAVEHMLHDKAARAQRERYLNDIGCGRESVKLPFDPLLEEPDETVDVKKVLDAGAILFPYKVAKALDPDIYRNIDFDNWLDSQRGKPWIKRCLCSPTVTRRSNIWNQNGGPLRVGSMCQVRWDGRAMKAHIHELTPDHGPAVVFIEEISQKRMVPFEDLTPFPRSMLKPEWSYAQKTQMINRFSSRNCDNSPEKFTCTQSRGRRRQSDDTANIDFAMGSDGSNVSDMDTSGSTPPTLRVLINSPLGSTVVNKSAQMSISADYSDLLMHDLDTLRYFFNMGIEYFHQGLYVSDPAVSPVDSQLAQACQGVPLIQPPPPTTLVSMTPPIFVDPNAGFAFAPLPHQPLPLPPSSPYQTVECHGTPVEVADNSPTIPSPPMHQEVTSTRRDGKERRNSRFTKPPRFQRLEMACKNAQVKSGNTQDIQVNEISSSTHPEPIFHSLPVAILPPPFCHSPYGEPEIQMAGEPVAMEVTYSDHPYQAIETVPAGYFEHDASYSPVLMYPYLPPYQ